MTRRHRGGSDTQAAIIATVDDHHQHLSGLRRDKAGADNRPTIAQQIEMDEARLLFEHHAIADRPAEGRALTAEHEGGADIGMTGERNLIGRREDANACGMRGIIRGETRRSFPE